MVGGGADSTKAFEGEERRGEWDREDGQRGNSLSWLVPVPCLREQRVGSMSQEFSEPQSVL